MTTSTPQEPSYLAVALPKENPMSRALWGASMGTAFEWYEFALYGSLAQVIARQFFAGVDDTTAFIFALLTFAVGFMMRPLGAMIFGHIGDQIGRKRTFVITISMMGAATVGVGCIPGYASIGITAPILLISLRVLQGVAAGGEYTGALTYVAEYSTSRKRGWNMSWTTAATTAGLLLSFLVILVARKISGDGFDTWGWRLPFLFSSVLLAVSLTMRLKMKESPAFERARQNRQLSKAPLKEALLDLQNVKRMLIAFGLCSGMTCMYYIAALYPTFFLTQLLKVDSGAVNDVVVLATATGLLAFPASGWLCDRIGRKPALLISFVLTATTVFPMYHALTLYANPALAEAQEKTPIAVRTQPDTCSLMFNPTGTRRFTSACDIAKQTLSATGVSYRIEPGALTDGTVISIGNAGVYSFDTAGLDKVAAAAKVSRLKAALRTQLNVAGYPEKAPIADFQAGKVFILLAVFFAVAILAVMTVGPALVEMFPTRVRYTSMSLPYNLAAGWVGGLLPTLVFAISAQTGDIYSGLWYPVGWVLVSLTALVFGFKETRDVDINAV